jgi:hypothetical protein
MGIGLTVMKKNEDKYQGWSNCATWCAAAFLNNTKIHQDVAIAACRLPKNRAGEVLKQVLGNHFDEVQSFSPWVWERGESISDVNVTELIEHFCDKIKEGS